MAISKALERGTVLDGKYKLDGMVGEGNFGITYMATNTQSGERVAIKEYFPVELCTREAGSSEVEFTSKQAKGSFEKGLKRFKEMATSLGKLSKEKGIVSVLGYFTENKTGYMVMEFIDGVTLKEYMYRNGGKIESKKVYEMLIPLLVSLTKVHKAGLLHRDICPDNIVITKENYAMLVDFGTARCVDNEGKSVTATLTQGFAPKEQFMLDEKQGPWTDVYALCATIYHMVSGTVPIDSVSRFANGEIMVPLKQICSECTKSFSDAVMYGLEVDVEKRCKSVAELGVQLGKKDRKIPVKVIVIGALVLVALIAIAVAILILTHK